MSKYKQHIKKDDLTTIESCHLRNLKLNSTQEINEWFRQSFSGDYYWINEIDTLISKLIEFKDKTVFIFGDYDADGITGTSIYHLGLKWSGFKDVQFKIPKRSEGFGVNKNMVDIAEEYLANKNQTPKDCVILTVDNGSAAIPAIKYAKEKGFTVLVTDHHDPYEVVKEDGSKEIILPEADVLINPKVIKNSAKFDGYCGAGVAYKVMSKLISNKEQLNKLETIAMVGTFCDVMDLIEENYVIAHRGLKRLNQNINNEVLAFKTMSYLLGIAHWDGTAIGFKFGPCLNALERLEDGASELGVRFLITTDFEESVSLGRTLIEYNERRKEETELALVKLDEKLASMPVINYPITVYLPDVKVGLCGILAGKLQERFNAPAGVFSDGPNGTAKGSYRSPDGFNIKEHLDLVADYFTHVGGHAGAAGATLPLENFDKMDKALQSTVKEIKQVEENDTYFYDLEIDNSDLPTAIFENEKFQPLGKGNEDLKFKVTNFKVLPKNGKYFATMSKDGIRLTSPSSSAIGFGITNLAEEITQPCTLTLYGSIQNNYWKKSNTEVVVTPQVVVDDFEIHNVTTEKSDFANSLFQKAKSRY